MQGMDSDKQMTQAQLWKQSCLESASFLLARGEKLSITAKYPALGEGAGVWAFLPSSLFSYIIGYRYILT